MGAVPRDPRLEILERHLGLIPGNEAEYAEARIEGIATAVAAHVDLDAVLAVAAKAPTTPLPDQCAPPDGSGLRIAYALDQAFGFYYQEDLDTLRDAGVRLITLNTLADERLPAVDGLILGGGFPEVFARRLEANRGLRQDIRAAIEAGLPTYAECGGLMYLSRAIEWKGERAEMVGVVPGEAVMGSRPVGRGYAVLSGTGASFLDAGPDRAIPAHEFHYSALRGLPDGLDFAYRMQRGHGIDGRHDGYLYKNLLAAYCHRRGTGAAGWIAPFLDKVRAHAHSRLPARQVA
jgi:cobyrinic acid a,c-diamide synthase